MKRGRRSSYFSMKRHYRTSLSTTKTTENNFLYRTPSKMIKFAAALLVTLAMALVANGEAVDTHKCACEAVEFGFDIDCNNTAAMLDAMTFLKASTCATDCSSAECEKNWLIVQVHHDYCPEGGVPEELEDGFHDYDMTCKHCDIFKALVEGAPDCPAPVCDDSSGNDAYVTLVEGGCLTDCASDTCRDNFFYLRAVHDVCEEGALTTDSEKGLHDLEASCAEQICNASDGTDDPLVCDEDHDHEDEIKPEEAAGASGVGASKSTTTGLAVLLSSAIIFV